MSSSTATDLSMLVDAVAARLGFHNQAGDRDRLALAIGERMRQSQSRSHADYLLRLSTGEQGADELRALADALTIGETYFFRGRDHLQVVEQALLPALGSGQTLRILSAGCASGEEPYTLAIMADQLGVADWVHIDGVDVSPRALRRAKAGGFSKWSLRDTPIAVRERYFSPAAELFQLRPALMSRVHFAQGNLLDELHPMWSAAPYEVIFCRNVLIYFAPAVISAVVARLAALLQPGGYLFLGHAETLHAAAPGLRLCSSHDTVYYRRLEAEPGNTEPASTQQIDWSAVTSGITRAVRPLPRATVPAAATATAKARPALAPDAAPAAVLQLVREERYQQALNLLNHAGPPLSLPFRQRVLRAELLFLLNRVDDAEHLGSELLRQHFLDAELHMLVALCREQHGDVVMAVEHARRASYLDPRFALPHLLLGRLARKAGQLESAQREFDAAAERLPADDESRLLLLGGGFGRRALIQYCQSQMQLCRGPHA